MAFIDSVFTVADATKSQRAELRRRPTEPSDEQCAQGYVGEPFLAEIKPTPAGHADVV
jgi:hypothetical protein